MEKAFFHFRKQYPNNEKKKKELAILLFNSTLEIQPFRNSNRTKNREFHFRKQLSNTRTRIATILSFASRIWFPKNRILEFLGAVIFTSYFSISIRRGEEGCIPNASVHTYAPIGYRCTWPNWKVDTLEFSGRKEPTSSRPPLFHLVRLLSLRRHPRRRTTFRLRWKPPFLIKILFHSSRALRICIFERERRKEKREFFTVPMASWASYY